MRPLLERKVKIEAALRELPVLPPTLVERIENGEGSDRIGSGAGEHGSPVPVCRAAFPGLGAPRNSPGKRGRGRLSPRRRARPPRCFRTRKLALVGRCFRADLSDQIAMPAMPL